MPSSHYIHINENNIENMNKRYRARFINSLSGFKSVNLIATENASKQSNVAIFSSVTHIGSSPALIGFITRPDTVTRNTLANIIETKQYTINQVTQSFFQQAHQTSARYQPHECEFAQTNLQKEYMSNIATPFVKESPLKYAVSLQEIVPIKLNNTKLIIGEITNIFCLNKAIQQDGYVDIEQLNTVCVSGLDSYHKTQRLSRLAYAKPQQALTTLSLSGQNNASTEQ